jgi:FkbM family methyltransferase
MPKSLNLKEDIGRHNSKHARQSPWWISENEKYKNHFLELFRDPMCKISFESTGELNLRNFDFGAVKSPDLFGLDELIIFSWYEVKKDKYKKVLDLGANVGAHTLVLSKLGMHVTSYEPDPTHFGFLRQTVKDNNLNNVVLREKAIGAYAGKANFTRVLGNTTGSHLSGSKPNPYGALEHFEVQVDAIGEVLEEGYDFVKMDVEGHEVALIEALDSENFQNLEIMLEVGTAANAAGVFKELNRLKVNAFSQKNNWQKVQTLAEIPTSHREGSLFITAKSEMDWGV